MLSCSPTRGEARSGPMGWQRGCVPGRSRLWSSLCAGGGTCAPNLDAHVRRREREGHRPNQARRRGRAGGTRPPTAAGQGGGRAASPGPAERSRQAPSALVQRQNPGQRLLRATLVPSELRRSSETWDHVSGASSLRLPSSRAGPDPVVSRCWRLLPCEVSWAFAAGHGAQSWKGYHQVWNVAPVLAEPGGLKGGQPRPWPGGGRLAQAPETHGLAPGSPGLRSGRPHPPCSLPTVGDLLAPAPTPHCRLEAPWTGGHEPDSRGPSSLWGGVPPGSPASISNQPRGPTCSGPRFPPGRPLGGRTRVPPGSSSSSRNSRTVPLGRGPQSGDATTIADTGGEESSWHQAGLTLGSERS